MTFSLTALKNLGNTCYMNTTIQALFATKEFREYMIERDFDSKLHSSVSKLFKDMIECGDNDETDFITPESFRNVFIQFRPEFNSKNQYDSQEFLRLLLDGIHEEVNEAKTRKRPKDNYELTTARDSWIHYIQYIDDSFLVKIFVGQLCSTIRCTQCNHKSQCWDTFWDISLSFPEGDDYCSLNQCLKAYTADEVMDNDSMPTCAECKTKRKSVKSLYISRSPLILTIILKRFGNDGRKLSKSVSIEPQIYLNSMLYELYACVCHHGLTTNVGHYNIYCRYESGNWYLFDDSSIEQIEDFSFNNLSEAYLLFYHMKDVSIKH